MFFVMLKNVSELTKGGGVVYGDEERVSLGTVGRVGEKIIQSEFL